MTRGISPLTDATMSSADNSSLREIVERPKAKAILACLAGIFRKLDRALGEDVSLVGYLLRARSLRPTQYAPPITRSAGKPTPAIGPGPLLPAKAGSIKPARPTKAKPVTRYMVKDMSLPLT